jgi:hypothetical protein
LEERETMTSQFDREVDILDGELTDGALSPEEHRRAIRELEQDYRAAAQEAAEDAYRDELGGWY